MPYEMLCRGCGELVREPAREHACAAGPGPFEFRYDYAAVRLPARPGSMWDYADLLPLDDPANAVTLGEGSTALLEARHRFGCRVVWKVEAQNPTGSQKDRALALAIAKARELGRQRVVIASTGGAGLACAAYAARAALSCMVLVPAGTPSERLLPMQALGARVVEIAGTFRDIERLLERLRDTDWYDATTKRAANPYQMEAPKTIAYELLDDIGRTPEWVIVPVGGGATLHGIWQGFEDLRRLGRIGETPRMVAVQPARFNTLEVALERGLTTQSELESIAMDERVDTVARNLKHGVPPDGADALLAIRRSKGTAVSVEDRAVLRWQRQLGAEEGIFCEPSSAAAPAALEALSEQARVGSDELVVAVLTGSGLREIGVLEAGPVFRLSADAGPEELDRILEAK
jgi:threonine synthase